MFKFSLRFSILSLAIGISQPASAFNVQTDAEKIDRNSFNRIAAELNLPLFWQNDTSKHDSLSPQNVKFLWGVSDNTKDDWIHHHHFTLKFYKAFYDILHVYVSGHKDKHVSAEEKLRRETVRRELSMGKPTLIHSDFSALSANEKRMVKNILEAAEIIETIFAKQTGANAFGDALNKLDASSKMLFYRNQGPWCVAPGTENDPNCNGLPSKPAKISGLYPVSIQSPGFCTTLAQSGDETLLSPFTAIVSSGNALYGLPYHVAYQDQMKQISTKLRAAAAAIDTHEEAAFKEYLNKAAQAFEDNHWQPADEAWAKMNANNSKWYLRIGPDEVYFEPCSRKAGFHVSFASINKESKYWQEKLEPLKTDMENTLATLAGPPYQARQVSFHLPDFIDIVLNAGNSRTAHGATIGQSLPNWGPVANEGRGRTVTMANLYTDNDSIQNARFKAESMLCPNSIGDYTDDSGPKNMSVVLHEAAHNLGPAHEYTVEGKKDGVIFGGPMASMLEELKAQSAALYFTDWLVDKGVIDKDFAKQTHTADVAWAFGHISQGMYTADGDSKTYSQLSAIQLGYLQDKRAISWQPNTIAANGQDRGCFSVDQQKLPEAIYSLTKTVAGIKARGDVPLAHELKEQYVDNQGDFKRIMDTIAQRFLRQPKASFVYSIDLD